LVDKVSHWFLLTHINTYFSKMIVSLNFSILSCLIRNVLARISFFYKYNFYSNTTDEQQRTNKNNTMCIFFLNDVYWFAIYFDFYLFKKYDTTNLCLGCQSCFDFSHHISFIYPHIVLKSIHTNSYENSKERWTPVTKQNQWPNIGGVHCKSSWGGQTKKNKYMGCLKYIPLPKQFLHEKQDW